VDTKKLLKLLTDNWSLKLLSVFAAVVLWLSVVGQENFEMSIRIPLELRNIPENIMVGNEVPTDVDLRLFGHQRRIRQAAGQNLAKTLDLSNLAEGEHFFILRPEDFSLPSGVEVLRVSPSTVQVNLVRTSTARVQVRPVLHGSPAKGYVVEDTVFNPPRVQVVGAMRDMDNLDWIWTIPVDVNDKSESFTATTRLRWPSGQIVRIDPYVVEVRIQIRPLEAAPEADGNLNNEATAVPRREGAAIRENR
jgi:YbbR domain-containing protein